MKNKTELVQEFKTHEKDTGSPDVQIALLTERIKHLSDHLQLHKKDHSSRRGLLMMVGRRSKLLKFLKKNQFERYRSILERLKIRR